MKGVGLCDMLVDATVDVVEELLEADRPSVDDEEDDDELDDFDRGWNQVAGRFRPFAFGTLNPPAAVVVSVFPPDIPLQSTGDAQMRNTTYEAILDCRPRDVDSVTGGWTRSRRPMFRLTNVPAPVGSASLGCDGRRTLLPKRRSL